MEHSETVNRDLWIKATPLSQAKYKLIPQELQKRWKVISEQSAMDTFQDTLHREQAQDPTGIQAIQAAFLASQPIVANRTAIEHECQRAFFKGLANGSLQGFAFEYPRRVSSCVVKLTSEYWRGRPQWDKNELHAHGIRFIEVRVIRVERIQIIEASKPLVTSCVGRPALAPDITDAFWVLYKLGKIDVGAPKVRAYPLIVQWLKVNRPKSLSGKDTIGDETIRRVIVPLIEQIKQETSPKL